MDEWIQSAKSATLADAVALLPLEILKRAGQELVGPCPQPGCGGRDRFSINIGKSKWRCRICAPKGGSAIDLVRHVEGVDFLQACEPLNGTPPPGGYAKPLTPQQKADRQRIREA